MSACLLFSVHIVHYIMLWPNWLCRLVSHTTDIATHVLFQCDDSCIRQCQEIVGRRINTRDKWYVMTSCHQNVTPDCAQIDSIQFAGVVANCALSTCWTNKWFKLCPPSPLHLSTTWAYITLITFAHHKKSFPCLPCGLFIWATYFTQITSYLTNAF